MRSYTLSVLFSLFFSFLPASAEQSRPILTVWVHGTTSAARRYHIDFITKALSCPPGLYPAQKLHKSYGIRKIVNIVSSTDPKNFPFHDFYIFGWSGLLCFDARKQAALDLYGGLEKLVKEYKQNYGLAPIIKIITHSHGGNVALNLAKINKHLGSKAHTEFKIDELILLACPVQTATKKYTQDHFFQSVYSFYSYGDFIQVADMQGLYKNKSQDLFSGRVFSKNPKVKQKHVTLYGRPIMHIEYLLSPFLTRLPGMLTEMKA